MQKRFLNARIRTQRLTYNRTLLSCHQNCWRSWRYETHDMAELVVHEYLPVLVIVGWREKLITGWSTTW